MELLVIFKRVAIGITAANVQAPMLMHMQYRVKLPPSRSSYLAVVPTQFILPPIQLIQTDKGLKASDRSGFESHVFPSLFLSLHLSRDVLLNSTKELISLPYDLYTPSVQSQLLDRICQKCSLYFASNVMLKSHMIVHKKKTQSASAVVEKEFIVTRTRTTCSQRSDATERNDGYHCIR